MSEVVVMVGISYHDQPPSHWDSWAGHTFEEVCREMQSRHQNKAPNGGRVLVRELTVHRTAIIASEVQLAVSGAMPTVWSEGQNHGQAWITADQRERDTYKGGRGATDEV